MFPASASGVYVDGTGYYDPMYHIYNASAFPRGPGKFSVPVVDGRRELEITERWSKSLSDLSLMYKKWLNTEDKTRTEKYNPCYLIIEAAFKDNRDWSSESVHSKS